MGTLVLSLMADTRAVLGFVGGAVLALPRTFTGRARFRGSDLARLLEDAGVDSLPTVGLLSFLIGMVLAFIGAVQLAQFDAQVYVADLVAIGMTREMGAMMTAIVMAGRVGAAYAAHIGTMQVNEEIDALRTLGIPPLEFLALPRLLALTLMLPLLCMYSDLLGILGGMRKRAGLARALALDPEILFFDEPSAGLDPVTSRHMDDLILDLRDAMGTTVVLVTHELPSIFALGDDSVFLDGEAHAMIAAGNPRRLLEESRDPRVRAFLTRGEDQ